MRPLVAVALCFSTAVLVVVLCAQGLEEGEVEIKGTRPGLHGYPDELPHLLCSGCRISVELFEEKVEELPKSLDFDEEVGSAEHFERAAQEVCQDADKFKGFVILADLSGYEFVASVYEKGESTVPSLTEVCKHVIENREHLMPKYVTMAKQEGKKLEDVICATKCADLPPIGELEEVIAGNRVWAKKRLESEREEMVRLRQVRVEL